MKKLQLVAVGMLLAASATVASAQEPQGGQRPAGGRPNMAAMVMQGITLTAEQQTKVDSIMKANQDAMMALRQDQSLDQDARRAKSMEMRNKQMETLKALLTDEQKKVFEKNLADMQARMQQGGGQRPPQK